MNHSKELAKKAAIEKDRKEARIIWRYRFSMVLL